MIFKSLATVLLVVFFSFGWQTDRNTIQWEAGHRLGWDDFKSIPDESATNAALTSSSINFKYNYSSDKGFSYTIACLFEKKSSWGRVKTDYILAHEQGHFDIAEIYARKLYKTIKAYNFNPATAQKEVPAMYRKIMKDLAAMQNQYDSETDYSREKEEQAEWFVKISQQLNSLKTFAAYH